MSKTVHHLIPTSNEIRFKPATKLIEVEEGIVVKTTIEPEIKSVPSKHVRIKND